MKLKVAEAAQDEIDRLDAWWVAHRDKNPWLFQDELAAAFEQITSSPLLGRLYDNAPEKYRWVLMPKTRHLVFYEYFPEEELVSVAMVWSPRPGGEPPLE